MGRTFEDVRVRGDNMKMRMIYAAPNFLTRKGGAMLKGNSWSKAGSGQL